MIKIQKKWKLLFGILAFVGIVTLSLSAGAVPGVAPEVIPPAVDDGKEFISRPIFHEGKLYLVQTKKNLTEKSVTETSRRVVAADVYRLADVNSRTGQYLFQTVLGENKESSDGVTTWLGDAEGKSVAVLTGAGYVKLSPGGSYIAATDSVGTLRIFDQSGKERSLLGKANNAVFSHDGTKIAFFNTTPYSIGDSHGISVVDLASGKVVQTYNPSRDAYIPLAFSRNASELFFVAEAKNIDPLSVNRVDVYALSVFGEPSVRLVTNGSQRLPYLDYLRAEYASSINALILSADNSVWIVDVTTGSTQVLSDVADAMWNDSLERLLVRSSKVNFEDQSWNIVDINSITKTQE